MEVVVKYDVFIVIEIVVSIEFIESGVIIIIDSGRLFCVKKVFICVDVYFNFLFLN